MSKAIDFNQNRKPRAMFVKNMRLRNVIRIFTVDFSNLRSCTVENEHGRALLRILVNPYELTIYVLNNLSVTSSLLSGLFEI